MYCNMNMHMRQKIASLVAERRTLLRYVLLPAASVMALILGGVLLWKYALDPVRALLPSEENWQHCFDGYVINVALLGFDREAERDRYYRIYRPDTIMIAALDLQETLISLVSIPRDSYVKIHGTGGYDKINHSYMYGHDRQGVEDPHRSGMDTVLKTIEDFLGGIPVHYYVSLDMDGVAEIIDQLGGLYFNVDVEVRGDLGKGRLLLEKGYQHLDGAGFLCYVRDRGTGGDLGRTQRQQRILVAAFKQLRRQGRLSELPGLYRSLTENVETNLSFRQMASLALFGTGVEPVTIKTHAFAGVMQYAPRGSIDALNYWVIDEQARVELIEAVFGVTVPLLTQITLPGPRRPEAPPSVGEPPPPLLPPEEPLPSDHRQEIDGGNML